MTEPEAATPPPPPWEGQPSSVKRHGVTVTNCDAEPIQTPGCVQAHGALLVLRPADLTALQASENVADLLGYTVADLLGHSVAVAVGPDSAGRLADFLAGEPADRNPLHAFTLPARAGVPPLDVIVHTTGGVVVAEFEATGRSAPTRRTTTRWSA